MMEEKRVRVRFAPSPTGYLHIGSARTALFNWLFAQSKKGIFLLRIEDTDKERSQKKYVDEILASLGWLGITWEGKPFYQTKRSKLYESYAKRLIEDGAAYEVKGGAMMFKMPKDTIVVSDLIRGPIEFDGSLQEDLVIMKSDGNPTYNFACVVDDIDMGITHVIRGEDHISNTPKQIALYQALGAPLPLFAHIPLILGEDRSRLSKRHGATSISEYRTMGYLPAALVNFMALLGWSPGDNREVMTRDELVRSFSLDRVVKTPAIFNQEKLNWINNQYIKNMDTETLTDLIQDEMKRCRQKGKKISRTELKNIVRLFKTRLKKISDFCDQAQYFFLTNVVYDKEAVDTFLRRKELKIIFNLLINDLKRVRPFNPETIEKCCRDLIQKLGIASGDLIHPARAAITGRTTSPGLFEVIHLLGKDVTVKRLKYALAKYCK
jgi:glutamyl-tRNA synthetase